jgi:hypothetical protein
VEFRARLYGAYRQTPKEIIMKILITKQTNPLLAEAVVGSRRGAEDDTFTGACGEHSVLSGGKEGARLDQASLLTAG